MNQTAANPRQLYFGQLYSSLPWSHRDGSKKPMLGIVLISGASPSVARGIARLSWRAPAAAALAEPHGIR